MNSYKASRPSTFAIRYTLYAILGLCAAAFGQSSTSQPQIGYLYPAGGQRGTVIQITVGGQFLRGADQVYISGDGVHGKVVKYIRPLRNIQREQRELLQARMKEVREKRLAELPIKYRPRSKPVRRRKTEDRRQKTENRKRKRKRHLR